jgi:hypothetical protein
MTLRYDARVRRGKLLARATLSPAGLLSGAALAAVGVGAGIVTWPWALGAGLAAWATSIVLHLRDPKLVSSLLAPQFDRDLSRLDGEHRRYMTAGLVARDRFEQAVGGLSDAEDFAGMQVRVNGALERLYDSLVWAQRAAQFLRTVNPAALRQRISMVPASSPVAGELAAQLEEVTDIERRRNEALARSAATVSGIETLAVKVGTLALEAAAPGELGHTEDIAAMRRELDGYLAGLEEIQESLRTLPPQPS